ncbi:MAG: hypothetical protein DCC58_03635 [Chloroflexi bacterium]|nr:MAG: hypothetical protein DCC58_03635 [Chloroflexota bacterium]
MQAQLLQLLQQRADTVLLGVILVGQTENIQFIALQGTGRLASTDLGRLLYGLGRALAVLTAILTAAAAIAMSTAALTVGLADQGCCGPAFGFAIANGDAPLLFRIAAIQAARLTPGIAIARFLAPAGVDGLDHVKIMRFADDDVVAARVEGIARVNGDHPAVAAVAGDLQPTDDAVAPQVPIMQFVLGNGICQLAVEFPLGE